MEKNVGVPLIPRAGLDTTLPGYSGFWPCQDDVFPIAPPGSPPPVDSTPRL
ncbi:MAG TPA: hypothetical protein VII61_05530 [Ktedonobacteraceae bacterium]